MPFDIMQIALKALTNSSMFLGMARIAPSDPRANSARLPATFSLMSLMECATVMVN